MFKWLQQIPINNWIAWAGLVFGQDLGFTSSCWASAHEIIQFLLFIYLELC